MEYLHWTLNEAFNETCSALEKFYPEYIELLKADNDKAIFDGYEGKHIAAQFSKWAKLHTRKVQCALETLSDDFFEGESIVVVDIGCGGGAASVAIVDKILRLRSSSKMSPFDIHLFGCDPNKHTLRVYDYLIQKLSKKIKLQGIHFDYRIVGKGMPEVLPYIADYLSQLRISLGKPRFPKIIFTQANVSHPLNRQYKEYISQTVNWLIDHKVNSAVLGKRTFGEIEAQSYEQLLSLSKSDKVAILTVGTHHQKQEYDQKRNVVQMEQALLKTITSKNHHVNHLHLANKKTPIQYRSNSSVPSYFYYSFLEITHQEYAIDYDWRKIISLDNLKLAWARVRASQLRESLVDEFEIRLFESKLEERLKEIQVRLTNYELVDSDYAHLDDRYPHFHYEFPKNEDKARPRPLLRLEEELISAAVVQVLGQRASALMSNVHAYRLSNEQSEHFYKSWFRGYKHFVRAVSNYASKLGDKTVIVQIDIKNFYPSINQNMLLEIAGQELRALRSDRIMWLLEKLLLRNMGKAGNGDRLGIPQGGTISGFLANLYLTKIHEKFNDIYEYARIFRYVDDMIIVIHDRVHEQEVINDLKRECDELGLTIPLTVQDGKFYRWEDVSKFKSDVELSDDINRIGWRFEKKMAHLYFMDEIHREHCSSSGEWWHFVKLYQTYLNSIGVYIKQDRLSRKLNQYIKNPRLRVKEGGQWYFLGSLKLAKITPNYPIPQKWAAYFKKNNSNWMQEVQKIKKEISELLINNWSEYKQSLAQQAQTDLQNYQITQKKLLAIVRFSIGRLARVGYESVEDTLVDIFCTKPEIVRDPRTVFEHLALQGNFDTLKRILSCLESSLMPGIDYLVGAILGSFRYLENSPDEEEISKILKYYALEKETSDVEKLMALQSIAFLSHCDARLATTLLEKLKTVEEPRIIAAIILILGEKFPSKLKTLPQNLLTDSFIKLAYETALTNTTNQMAELWKPIETESLIRFYASAYPDGADEFEDGSSP